MPKRVFAVGAHPDDIEFMMAGTLILLGRAGYALHYMTIANGSCGTDQYDVETIVKMRRQESINAADYVGAVYHESLVNDLEIFYEKSLLQQVGAVVREVAPEIILTHAPWEYMEDHTNTCRLVQTAAFARGMRNFSVAPPHPPVQQPVTLYHALPYGLRNPLGQRVAPGFYVDISEVLTEKREMLARHTSQKTWLDVSQGVDAYLNTMETMSREVGQMSGQFTYAEGWTRHLPLGYGPEDTDPLRDALPDSSMSLGAGYLQTAGSA